MKSMFKATGNVEHKQNNIIGEFILNMSAKNAKTLSGYQFTY